MNASPYNRFHRPENWDALKKFREDLILYVGENDWEESWTSAWVEQGKKDCKRVWMKLSYPSNLLEPGDEKSHHQSKELKSYADKVVKTWIRTAESICKTKEDENYKPQLCLDDFEEALKSDDVAPCVKESGKEQQVWSKIAACDIIRVMNKSAWNPLPYVDDAAVAMMNMFKSKQPPPPQQQQQPPKKPLNLPAVPFADHERFDNNSTGGNLLMTDKTAAEDDLGSGTFNNLDMKGGKPVTEDSIKSKITPQTPELQGGNKGEQKASKRGMTTIWEEKQRRAEAKKLREQGDMVRKIQVEKRMRLNQQLARKPKYSQGYTYKFKPEQAPLPERIPVSMMFRPPRMPSTQMPFTQSQPPRPTAQFDPTTLRKPHQPAPAPQPANQDILEQLKTLPRSSIPSRVMSYVGKHKVPIAVGGLAAGAVGSKLLFDMINRKENKQEDSTGQPEGPQT